MPCAPARWLLDASPGMSMSMSIICRRPRPATPAAVAPPGVRKPTSAASEEKPCGAPFSVDGLKSLVPVLEHACNGMELARGTLRTPTRARAPAIRAHKGPWPDLTTRMLYCTLLYRRFIGRCHYCPLLYPLRCAICPPVVRLPPP